MRWSRVSLAVGLAAGLLGCKDAKQSANVPITGKLLLRYHPPEGAVYHYTVDESSRFGPDSATADTLGRNAMLLVLSQLIGARDADGIHLTTTLDSARVSSPLLDPTSAADMAGRMRGLRLTAVFDDRQRLLRSDFTALRSLPPAVSDQVQLGFRGVALALPEQPVGTGDSWTNEVALPVGQMAGGPPLTTTTKLTVREVQVARGDTTVRLALETTLPDRPLQFTMAGQPVTVAVRGALTGEQVFSLTRGAIVSASFGGTMRVTVAGGFFGPQGMVMRIDQRGTMALTESGH